MLAGEGDTVFLKIDEDACDARRFRSLLERGGKDAIDGIHDLEQAVALYRGPLLQGFSVSDAPLFEEWVRAEESTLRLGYLDALQRLVSLAESRERWDEAITYAQHIVQADPLSENVRHRLIQMYLRAGAIGQALRQYREFEAVLQQELSLAPSPETWAAIASAMEARRNAKRDVFRLWMATIAPWCEPACACWGKRAGSHQGAIVAIQRRDVGNGANGYQIQPTAQIQLFAQRRAQRLQCRPWLLHHCHRTPCTRRTLS